MKKQKILTPALVVVVSFLSIYSIVWSASTVGTNLSTTGTLAVTGVTTLSDVLVGTGASLSVNFEVVGYASISGDLKFGGTGTHTLGVSTGSGALTINAFTLGGLLTGNSNNITGLSLLTTTNGSASATFEALTVKTDTLANSTGTLTINAFTLGGALTGNSNNITGVSQLGATNASVSTKFEALTASISNIFAKTSIVAGGSTASSSNAYVAEFVSTATTSVLFGGSSATLGTCLQLKNTVGATVYARIVGTTFTVSTVSCR